MKIILFSRHKVEHRAEDIDEIFASIGRFGFDFTVNREFAETIRSLTGRDIPAELQYGDRVEPPQGDAVMVCCGGDGTLLEAVRRLDGADVPLVGVNSGRLGFLALASRSEIAGVFRAIAEGGIHYESRAMLRIDGVFDGSRQPMYALNEVSVQRLGATMISTDAAVDGEHVSTYNGDRNHNLHSDRLHSLFAECRRSGHRADLPQHPPYAAFAAQSDDATDSDVRFERDFDMRAYPRKRRLGLHRQPYMGDRRRRGIHGASCRKENFFGCSAQYILLRHVTE